MKTTKSLFGTLAIAAGLAMQVHAQSGLTNGLVGFYPFNGNANDAAGTNNGTVYGATLTTNRFNELNKAYHFDGQSRILASDAMLPMGSAPRTISLWVNVSDSDTNRVYSIPFQYGGSQPSQGIWITIVTHEDVLHRPPGTVWCDFYDQWVMSSTRLQFGTWQHLVCSFDNTSTARFYLNGVLTGSNPVNINTTPAGAMSIGSDAEPVLGDVDDVRIYERALSPTEVKQLYEQESGPRATFVKACTVDYSNLTLGLNYQLQASADLTTWTNYGAAFTATSVNYTNTAYQRIEDWGKLFFRLQQAP